ncbi:MAG: hydantoinase/oxoprolinase family protein [Desulfobacterales bacterium]|jgi:N-methylhydantoinase A/oxoprolinase/acetone carboxylase beta subunit
MIIGLDVGGTHADVVMLGNEGVVNEVKVPTDPKDLFHTVLTALDRITADIDPARIERVVMSTTLTTNAIIQGKLPPVGMIVSAGPGIDPQFYRTNDHFACLPGSIDHRGREIEPIEDDAVRRIKDQFLAQGLRHVGIVTKFSVRNAQPEFAIARQLDGHFEKLFLGHRISGNLSFPRRIATTYLNAAVYPIHREFFAAVKNSLVRKGLKVPIRILKADGGNMNFEASIDYPAQTIFSGPAASVMGSIAFGPETGDTLVMDIGGTTTDMAVLVDQVPLLAPEGVELGGYKTLIRSLQTHSIGIGGDSAVRIAKDRILIGPHRDGPALAHGGPSPTPTDALVILGKARKGSRELSVQGFASIAEQLGVSVEEAAFRVFDQTCRNILDEAEGMIARINRQPVYTVHEMQDGYQIRPETILVLGGPAPLFAAHLEHLSNYRVGVVPRWAVANAIGAALARTTCEVSLYADTEQQVATAPEEDFRTRVDRSFDRNGARQMALDLLRNKAVARGADPEHLEMEVTEDLQFNMVRGFHTTGRNIRIRAQVQPGLIHGYDPVAGRLM